MLRAQDIDMTMTFTLPPIEQIDPTVDSSFEGILGAVGNTPLVRLHNYPGSSHTQLWAKLESCNPGGSAKDRPARHMISEALRVGRIDRSSVIIESSSGNMGVGLAQTCRYYGLRFICIVDPRVQAQNLELMRAYGAEIRLVEKPDPEQGDYLTARLKLVRSLTQTIPNAYWPNQYANLLNPASHAHGTMAEIDRSLEGCIDYLFVATSSTGTIRGCAEYLSSRGRSTQIIAVDSVGSRLFGGRAGTRKISGFGAGTIPPLAEGQCFHSVARMTDLDCVVGCRRLVQTEAILAGGSSGGVMEAVRQWLPQLSPGSTCAAILHDGGARYLSTVYNDEWVHKELGCSPEELARLVGAQD